MFNKCTLYICKLLKSHIGLIKMMMSDQDRVALFFKILNFKRLLSKDLKFLSYILKYLEIN